MPKKKHDVVTARMDSEHFSWLAVGRTEEEACATLARLWDERLAASGDEDRERSLYAIGAVEDGEPKCGFRFGCNLPLLAKVLDEYYSINVTPLNFGEGEVR